RPHCNQPLESASNRSKAWRRSPLRTPRKTGPTESWAAYSWPTREADRPSRRRRRPPAPCGVDRRTASRENRRAASLSYRGLYREPNPLALKSELERGLARDFLFALSRRFELGLPGRFDCQAYQGLGLFCTFGGGDGIDHFACRI